VGDRIDGRVRTTMLAELATMPTTELVRWLGLAFITFSWIGLDWVTQETKILLVYLANEQRPMRILHYFFPQRDFTRSMT